MRLFTCNTQRISLVVSGLISVVAAHAAGKIPETKNSPDSLLTNGVFLVMFAFSILLLLGIIGMAEMVKAGATQRRYRDKKKKENDGAKNTIAAVGLLLVSGSLMARQTETGPVAEPPFTYWGMGAAVFFSMLAVIVFELLIFYMLYRTGISLLRDERAPRPVAKPRRWLMETAVMKSMTEAVPVEEEEALLMDHEYDGIRELDNNLPSWWKYGFYLTIVVSVIYMFNYHVFHTGKSSAEEYEQELIDAEKRIAEYRKSTANLVDENTVVRLTDAASLSAGQSVFKQNCVPCHGELAEGKEGLGPNLTDDHWLHKGGTADIFKSIKYGWTDKGMKAWEQDLKPLEIQQLVSWIQSVQGSDPPNAKAPEGDVYVGESQKKSADTTGASIDSMPVNDSMKK